MAAHICIPNYSLTVKPLFVATRGVKMSHVSGGSSSRGLSDRKENSSSGRPLLVLPDVIREFSLFMNEKEGVSLSVLSQNRTPAMAGGLSV